eukprot:4354105-Prymnesium_polylepis.1
MVPLCAPLPQRYHSHLCCQNSALTPRNCAHCAADASEETVLIQLPEGHAQTARHIAAGRSQESGVLQPALRRIYRRCSSLAAHQSYAR